MNCGRITGLLDEYIDGALSGDEKQSVEEHLSACPDCRREVDDIRSLLAEAAALPREVEPERDLWPGVARQIRRSPQAWVPDRWWSPVWAALAAAAVLAIAVVVRFGGVDGVPVPGVARETSLVPGDAAEFRLVSEEVRARNGLMQVREDLMRSIAERRGSLDAETQQMIDRNLELIDHAISEIHQALEDNPDNQGLEFLLAAAYQRELELLRQINLL